MKNHYAIIKGPVVTEKATALTNKVVFWVDRTANKKDVKEAIEKVFSVKVLGVNTHIVPGKIKKMGRHAGRRPTRKKAYITLREGDKIDLFEGI